LGAGHPPRAGRDYESAGHTASALKMPPEQDYHGWRYLNVAVRDQTTGEIIGYRIHFYRKTDDWYDETRYDSHEIKAGRRVPAPHFHLKLATPYKDRDRGERELREVIDRILPALREITG